MKELVLEEENRHKIILDTYEIKQLTEKFTDYYSEGRGGSIGTVTTLWGG
jgi:hypothetical protein